MDSQPQITKTALDKQRRLDKAERERKKREAALLRSTEADITQTETRISALEALFSQPDTYADGNISSLQKEYNTLKEKLEALYLQWENLSSQD